MNDSSLGQLILCGVPGKELDAASAEMFRKVQPGGFILRGRCYGKTVEQVVRNAGAFNDAMQKQGIASCGKHFPGYTCAKSDAHFELPKIGRTRQELEQNELAVFKQLIDRVDSMMICHGWYPSLVARSEEHTSELQSPCNLVCRLLLEKK